MAFVGKEPLHLRALPFRILADECEELAVRHRPHVELKRGDEDFLRVLLPAKERAALYPA